jgi:hypothetical protein
MLGWIKVHMNMSSDEIKNTVAKMNIGKATSCVRSTESRRVSQHSV